MKKKLKIWWDYYPSRTICGVGIIAVLISTYRLIGTTPTAVPEVWGWSDIIWFWVAAFCWVVVAYSAGTEAQAQKQREFKELEARMSGATISVVTEEGEVIEQDFILAVRLDGIAIILQNYKPEMRDMFVFADAKELLAHNVKPNTEDAK